jgi:DNA modification methylase
LNLRKKVYNHLRSVWTVPTRAFKGAHFATFPPDLIRICITAGWQPGGVVLDPFMGAGTTAVVAQELGRNYIGIELNADYVRLAEERIISVK